MQVENGGIVVSKICQMANISGSRHYVGLTELDALGYVIVQKTTLRRKNRTQVSSLGR